MVTNFCGDNCIEYFKFWLHTARCPWIDNYIHAKYIYQKLSCYGGIYFAHTGKQGDNFYTINLSIARGLGYYTGIIYETILNDLPNLGSVCSGGRYDNLTQNFSNDKMSGVGASIGLDRLLAGLEELNLITQNTPAEAILIPLNNLQYAYTFAQNLRNLGMKIEVYPEITKPQKAFKYANNKGYKWVIITGENEESTNTASLKDMQSGEQKDQLSLQTLSQIILDS